jgi:TolA-binding protein
VLKQVELFTSGGGVTNAITRLENYLASDTNEPAADLLRVKASDLWLMQFRVLAATDPSPSAALLALETNALTRARSHLNIVLTEFTNSVYIGKAWLNLGWTFWEEGSAFDDPARTQESVNAFRTAIEKLTRSDDQALARFKLADAEYSLGRYADSITNYNAVIQQYGDLPQVKNSLFEKSYRKIVRANLELKDFSAAQKELQAFRAAFPQSPLVEDTVYIYGQSLARNGRPAEARKVFEQFQKDFPQSPQIPQARFAEARAYINEGNLEAAIKQDESWLAAYTNHALRAEVEFQRATLYDKSGRPTNAFALFTNFVAQFPVHPLAPAAQNWVADYYYAQQEWPLAEQNYQKIFQNTNWTTSPLFLESRLMAAKTAFFRQAYSDAKSYLTNIITDPRSPTNLVVQALFELGDVTIEEPITGTTNKLSNYTQASIIFDRIAQKYPGDPLAPLAWGKKGDCHLQLYPTYAQSFEAASNAYSMVLQLRTDQTPPSVVNQAEYGLGLLFERAADTKEGPEKTAFLKKALAQYLNVVYGANLKGQPPSPVFLKLAGRSAGRLAETLGEDQAALELYRRLLKDLPSMKPVWESKISALQQKLAAN